MTSDDDATTSPTVVLPLAEAASRLGLHPSALRSRIRRGQVTAKRGNDGRLLVEVPASSQPDPDLATASPRPEHGVVTASPDDELGAEIDLLRDQLAAARIAEARAVAERDAAERIIVELRSMLAEARKGWLKRVIEALRRTH
jgi:hypothetical protein